MPWRWKSSLTPIITLLLKDVAPPGTDLCLLMGCGGSGGSGVGKRNGEGAGGRGVKRRGQTEKTGVQRARRNVRLKGVLITEAGEQERIEAELWKAAL